MSAVKMYVGTPPVLTTFSNVTLDATHPIAFQDVGEETEYDVDVTDDAENQETTTFIGISPKR